MGSASSQESRVSEAPGGTSYDLNADRGVRMEPETSKGWRLYTEIFPEEYCVLCCTTDTEKMKHRRKLSSKQLLARHDGLTHDKTDI